jgi:hypothetical protein
MTNADILKGIAIQLSALTKEYLKEPKQEIKETIEKGLEFYHTTASSLGIKGSSVNLDLKPLFEGAFNKAVELMSQSPSMKLFKTIEQLYKLMNT